MAKDVKFLHADNENSDLTAQVRRLIRVFVGRTWQKVHSLTMQLKYALLTFITFWANSVDDKMILFLIFFQGTKFLIKFTGKNKKNISVCRLPKILHRALSVKV